MQIRQRFYPCSTNTQAANAKNQVAFAFASFGYITDAEIELVGQNIHATGRRLTQLANLSGLNTAARESFGS
ncbi:MAG: hypothetical protein M1288_01160 [Actinobacteria bacterium]|jgi:hypothetical protein|nr:hypothetical protein [Actinomycetota bacterium]